MDTSYQMDEQRIPPSDPCRTSFQYLVPSILAAVHLFGAIITLYLVQNERAVLGKFSPRTVFLAACVGLLTNARRDQILGATAAYAAVLIVIVSGNLRRDPATPGTCVYTLV